MGNLNQPSSDVVPEETVTDDCDLHVYRRKHIIFDFINVLSLALSGATLGVE